MLLRDFETVENSSREELRQALIEMIPTCLRAWADATGLPYESDPPDKEIKPDVNRAILKT